MIILIDVKIIGKLVTFSFVLIFRTQFPLSQFLPDPPHLSIHPTLCSFSFKKKNPKNKKTIKTKMTKQSKMKTFILIYMYKCLAGSVCAWCLWRIKEGVIATGTGVMGSCEPIWGFWELILGPLCKSSKWFYLLSHVSKPFPHNLGGET